MCGYTPTSITYHLKYSLLCLSKASQGQHLNTLRVTLVRQFLRSNSPLLSPNFWEFFPCTMIKILYISHQVSCIHMHKGSLAGLYDH